MTLPPAFVKTTIDVHGDAGAKWLNSLPELLTECAARWSLTIETPFVPLTYNYVAPAVRRDGARIVVKAGVPHHELAAEIAALRCFDGQSAVRLLDADAEKGILLLEHLTPGTSLLSLDDDETATEIAAHVMRDLWRPVPADHPFPTISDWVIGLERLRHRHSGGTGPLPVRLVEEAETLSTELTASIPVTVLLHGDLHHGNVLRAQRTPWLAIDPKGVVGDPAFEASAFLLNPKPQSTQRLARRIQIFADIFGMPSERVCGWARVRAVLSAWWSLEDHGAGGDDAITVADRLSSLK